MDSIQNLAATYHQALIIPHVTDKGLGDFLEEPALKNLLYASSAIKKNLVSCVGGALFVGMAYWLASVKKVQGQSSLVVSARESKAVSGVIED